MTLTLTLRTPRRIYQSADYRLVDAATGRAIDFETQKVALCSGREWTATVAFSGVGRSEDLDVSQWLAERTKPFVGEFNRTFDELVASLTQADEWLARISRRDLAKHSLAIGAFVGSEVTFVLISNFETPTDLVSDAAAPGLTVYRQVPRRSQVFVSGQKRAGLPQVRLTPDV